jgi:hypothetical protein
MRTARLVMSLWSKRFRPSAGPQTLTPIVPNESAKWSPDGASKSSGGVR